MPQPIKTSLNAIHAARPSDHLWGRLTDHLKVSPVRSTRNKAPLAVSKVLEASDIEDTLWVVDRVIGNRHLCRLFAADCAEMVLPLFERAAPDDQRPRRAIEMARRPDVLPRDLEAASLAARSAGRETSDRPAEHAADAASRAAARNPAWADAWEAARMAVWKSETLQAAIAAEVVMKERLAQYLSGDVTDR
jgi:hypothetical protein